MGSGKSTVGKTVAKELGYFFVDTDSVVEEDCSMLIRDMFDQYGEEYFREREYEALQKVIGGKNQIISTGGGIVTYDKSRELLSGQTVCYIEVSAEEVYRRLKNDTTRPLLKDISINKIDDLLNKRKPLYEVAGKIKVDGSKPLDKVVQDIIIASIDK